jgi:hypothetical protein
MGAAVERGLIDTLQRGPLAALRHERELPGGTSGLDQRGLGGFSPARSGE